MIREEAISYLQPIADSASLPRYAEALNMAIAALRYDGPKYVLLSTPPADAQTIDTGVPFTNADHIRSMSDEELAYLLHDYYCEGHADGLHHIYDAMPIGDVREWLKQPYKEEV